MSSSNDKFDVYLKIKNITNNRNNNEFTSIDSFIKNNQIFCKIPVLSFKKKLLQFIPFQIEINNKLKRSIVFEIEMDGKMIGDYDEKDELFSSFEVYPKSSSSVNAIENRLNNEIFKFGFALSELADDFIENKGILTGSIKVNIYNGKMVKAKDLKEEESDVDSDDSNDGTFILNSSDEEDDEDNEYYNSINVKKEEEESDNDNNNNNDRTSSVKKIKTRNDAKKEKDDKKELQNYLLNNNNQNNNERRNESNAENLFQSFKTKKTIKPLSASFCSILFQKDNNNQSSSLQNSHVTSSSINNRSVKKEKVIKEEKKLNKKLKKEKKDKTEKKEEEEVYIVKASNKILQQIEFIYKDEISYYLLKPNLNEEEKKEFELLKPLCQKLYKTNFEKLEEAIVLKNSGNSDNSSIVIDD
ncbi:hypothetical protein ABK040_011618 [Willaertia magna]